MPAPIDVGTRLKCPHCGIMGIFTCEDKHRVSISAFKVPVPGGHEVMHHTGTRMALCPNPACKGIVIDWVEVQISQSATLVIGSKRLHPELPSPLAIDAAVPHEFTSLVQEANQIREISPRAAACLLRHCLEAILVEKNYGKEGDYLEPLIAKASADTALASSLIEHFGLLQQIGGFGSHAMGLKVEPGEIDQLFDSIDAAFDFFFVQPHKLAEAKKRTNEKLASVDRKPMKDRRGS